MKVKRFCLAAGLLLACCSAMAADLELEITEQTLNRLVTSLGNPSAGGLFQPNALGGLGYNNCTPLGVLNCNYGSGGTGTATRTTAGQNTGRSNFEVNSVGTRVFDIGAVGQSPSSKQVPISLCQGPDGQPVVSPTVDRIAWQWWITEANFAVAANQLTFSATARYRIGSKWFSVAQTVPASLSVDTASHQLQMTVSNFIVPISYNVNGAVQILAQIDVGRYVSFAMPMNSQTISAPNLAGNAMSVTSRINTANVTYIPGSIIVSVDAGFN
jgi:hypothetical protein